jgi:hypothetical protein
LSHFDSFSTATAANGAWEGGTQQADDIKAIDPEQVEAESSMPKRSFARPW